MTKLLNPAGRFIVLFRVGGVEIGFTPSWLFMVTFLAILFRWWGIIPVGTGKVAGAAMAVGLSLAFYVSVLLHEAAHTLVANIFGLQPRRIVLFLLGGVSQISLDAEQPRQEYLVALSGPVVSLLLGGIFALLAKSAGSGPNSILSALSTLNVALAAFNMIPGFPLDGGRVLRSLMWSFRGDRIQATRTAAAAGRIVAAGLSVGGIAYVVIVQRNWATFVFVTWFVILGYFLFSHASYAEREELERLALREQVRQQEVSVAATAAPTIAPDIVPERRKKPRVTPKTRETTILTKPKNSRRGTTTTRSSARLDVLKKPRTNESNSEKSKKNRGR